MAASLLELFRLLSSFSPPRTQLREAPWEEFVDWSIANGLAPLAAYNLEYRLIGSGAPDWVRDRLLSIYQGSVNDNVMKLVSFKRAIGDLQGRRVLILGSASYAESLYPHVAFRPVTEIRARVEKSELEPFAGFLREGNFNPLPDFEGSEGAARVLTDGHVALLLYTDLLGTRRASQEQGILQRALPVKVYGPSAFRPDLEDAVLLTCLEQARAGYEVPLLTFVDLRELLLGSPSMSGPYSRPPNLDAIRTRAAEWRIERAAYASLSIVGRLFPETEAAVQGALPQLRQATRTLLDRTIVDPISQLGRVSVTRGMDRLRRLLAG